MHPIFRCNGQYVGFINDNSLFSTSGVYLGWIDAQSRVWNTDGQPMGELSDSAFVIRPAHAPSPIRQPQRQRPLPVGIPPHPGDRVPYRLPLGWLDALAKIGRLPSEQELADVWRLSNQTIELVEGGQYQWVEAEGIEVVGTWELRSNLLITQRAHSELADAAEFIYRIDHYDGTNLTLVWLSEDARLPLKLTREH